MTNVEGAFGGVLVPLVAQGPPPASASTEITRGWDAAHVLEPPRTSSRSRRSSTCSKRRRAPGWRSDRRRRRVGPLSEEPAAARFRADSIRRPPETKAATSRAKTRRARTHDRKRVARGTNGETGEHDEGVNAGGTATLERRRGVRSLAHVRL